MHQAPSTSDLNTGYATHAKHACIYTCSAYAKTDIDQGTIGMHTSMMLELVKPGMFILEILQTTTGLHTLHMLGTML